MTTRRLLMPLLCLAALEGCGRKDKATTDAAKGTPAPAAPNADATAASPAPATATLVNQGTSKIEVAPATVTFHGQDDGGAATLSLISSGGARARLGDRFYLTAVLSRVFGPTSASLLAPKVRVDAATFGGPCDQLGLPSSPGAPNRDLDVNLCSTTLINMSQAPALPSSVPARAAILADTCERLAIIDTAVTYAAQQTGQSATKAPTADGIVAAYGLFHPGLAPGPDVVTALAAVVKGGATPLDGWRYLMLTLCLAPDWQLL